MNNEPTHDDEFFERHLSPLESDAAPLDADSISDAVAAAGQVFASADAVHAGTSNHGNDSENETIRRESRTMFSFAKPLAVLAASAALLLVTVLTPKRAASANVTLGDVLDRLQEAKSLQLELSKDGEETEITVAGNAVRWQESTQCYRIASGSRLWKVDEAVNSVSDEENPLIQENGDEIDLLALIGGRSSVELRSVRAS